VELVEEAGFPPGVINMVHGDAEAVDTILRHPAVKGVSFVGSTAVGRDIIYREACARGKRVQAQCGAKNF
jgi:malonate-semialdehyde dehydrogenase (acetylating)/methylmalonate-semialdehyde dehydrogenase